ncbi:MAG: hypothetical protein AAGF29_08620 [Pseudomonadota bacterium]
MLEANSTYARIRSEERPAQLRRARAAKAQRADSVIAKQIDRPSAGGSR